MTQVAQIFEEEKRQAVERVLKRAREEKRQAVAAVKEKALKREQEEKRQMVIGMIKKNYPIEDIVSIVSGYSKADVEQLQKEIML